MSGLRVVESLGSLVHFSMLGGGFSTLKEEGVNSRNWKTLTSVREIVTGKNLEGAHGRRQTSRVSEGLSWRAHP